MSRLIVETKINGPLSENTYFVHYDDNDEGFLIDPGMDEKAIDKIFDGTSKKVKFIILTHSHFDHILTCDYYRKKFDCPVYVSEYENEMLKDPDKNLSHMFHCTFSISDAIELKGKSGVLNKDGFNIKYFVTPGHTLGGLCIYLQNDKVMFTGDTMFKGTYGRTDLYGGNDEEMKKSLKEIFTYDDDIIIYPGHGDPCTIGDNKIYIKEDIKKL